MFSDFIRPDRLPGLPAAPRALLAAAVMVSLSACKNTDDAPTGPVTTPIISRASLAPSSSPGYVEARTSQIVSNGALPAQVFDDFTFTSASTIRTASWQGIYCRLSSGAAAPTATATAFRVSFYADSSGSPRLGTPLAAATYSLAQSAQTFEKNQAGLICGSTANTNWSFYRYSVTLSAPFVAAANTKYWFSVQAFTPSYDVYFGWRDGLVDNRSSLQRFNGTYTTFGFDRAFSLTP